VGRETGWSDTQPEGGDKISEELKRTVAFLFQGEGDELEKEDFIYRQSVDLEWFSSDGARKLLELAEKKGFVTVENDVVKAKIDYNNVDIPMGFEPGPDLIEDSGEENVFDTLMREVLSRADMNRQELIARANRKQDKLNIDIKVAILMVAQEEELDLPDKLEYIEKIEDELRGR
jgi:hypothetical protein